MELPCKGSRDRTSVHRVNGGNAGLYIVAQRPGNQLPIKRGCALLATSDNAMMLVDSCGEKHVVGSGGCSSLYVYVSGGCTKAAAASSRSAQKVKMFPEVPEARI